MKKVLGLCLALVGLLALAGVCQAAEIKIALDSPPDMEKSGTYVWAKTFGDHLKANGMAVKEFPRDALGAEEEKLDQVSQGLLEVSMSDLAKAGQLEGSIFGFNLPYIFDSMEHMDRTLQKTDLFKKVNDGTTKKGVRVLSLVAVGGFGGLSTTKKPVSTPEDLKGLRIRAMDKSQAQYLEAWGAGTVIVPWAEIYNALQTGIADGYLNAAVVPLLFKHTEVLKFYSDLRFAAPLRVAICSEDWYKKLKPDQKKIVDDAAAKATAANRAWQVQIDKTGLEDLEKAGTKITRNTAEQRALFAKLARTVYEKIVSREVAEAFVKASDANR
ncbi:MAG: TRAP transporter substrate-binding protein [Syntrophobacteraceae bacterium]|jgi:TRAP-type C4-dicarboxylate transport system substrate-binding protein|nr:TRAP transporter substrate-binding protein [Syntrophobacteraceae bacterium]